MTKEATTQTGMEDRTRLIRLHYNCEHDIRQQQPNGLFITLQAVCGDHPQQPTNAPKQALGRNWKYSEHEVNGVNPVQQTG
jgi:hypothetical protein